MIFVRQFQHSLFKKSNDFNGIYEKSSTPWQQQDFTIVYQDSTEILALVAVQDELEKRARGGYDITLLKGG